MINLSWKGAGVVIVVIGLLAFGCIQILSPDMSAPSGGTTVLGLSADRPAFGDLSAQRPYVFDVPSVVGMKATDLSDKLGAPAEMERPEDFPVSARENLTELNMEWKNGPHSLIVTWDTRTGNVKNFFCPTMDASGSSTKIDELRVAMNAREVPRGYRLQPVPAINRAGEFTGLMLIPDSNSK